MSEPLFFELDSIHDHTESSFLKKTVLKSHQKKALNYMRLLESENPIPIFETQGDKNDLYLHTNYGFYADPVSTGKSFVILSLISMNKCIERKKMITIWSNGLGMNVYSKIKNFEIPLSILVCPVGSVGQWTELLSSETDLKFCIIDDIEKVCTYDYDVLLVTDALFESVCLHFQGFSVSRLIFDDLSNLKIEDTSGHSPKGKIKKYIDIKASFTWFISSRPQECIKKYRYSSLPFSIQIRQIFSFPHPGLLFRNKIENIRSIVEDMLPDIKMENTHTFYPSRNNFERNMTITHDNIIPLFVNSLEITIKDKEDIEKDLSNDLKTTFSERYSSMTDPITYEKIEYPSCMECCFQIFDLVSLCKCIYIDFRCPICRKDFDFSKISLLDKKVYESIKRENIWNILERIDHSRFNVLYIPTARSKSFNKTMYQFCKELKQKMKCILYNKNIGNTYNSSAYKEFQEKKGILLITKPFHSNLHLTFVDNVYVIHPTDYSPYNKIEWFSDKLLSKYGDKYLSHLSDSELGSFCIGSEKPIQFNLITI